MNERQFNHFWKEKKKERKNRKRLASTSFVGKAHISYQKCLSGVGSLLYEIDNRTS